MPELPRILGSADLALVQGGLTTCMELTAQRVPFLAVPLRNHFEQTFHVQQRLRNYGAGTPLDYDQVADPNLLATALVGELTRETSDWRPVESDGAARAAALLADLL